MNPKVHWCFTFKLTAGLATPWPNHIFGVGGAGWDVMTFVAHEHMFDATQQLGLRWDGVR